jgi:hypothetical protein
MLTPERVEDIFGGSIDFARREFLLGNDPGKRVELCYVMGQLRVERANDYVLRPLCDLDPLLILPGQTRTAAQLLAALPVGPAVTPYPL